MNLEQLRGFVEIAQTGHFTRAAEQLHVAQPTLSRQIATLENELGIELFHRARGNITLTAAGENLLPIAKRMLSDSQMARGVMGEMVGLQRGRIRLGATPTLCTSVVVEVLSEFQSRHPKIEIEILERGSRSLIQELLEGSLDLALIVTSISSGTEREVLELEPLLNERLVVVSAATLPDPFDGKKNIQLEDLAQIPQVVFPKTYDLRGAVDAALHGSGLAPSIAVEGAEMDATLRFAERGIGVAVVPALVTMDRPNLRVTHFANPGLNRNVYIARRSDMTPTHAGAALRSLIREIADRFSAPGAETEHLVRRLPEQTPAAKN